MAETFSIEKMELRRLLANLKVSDKNIEFMLTQLDKMHRHINVLALVEMLERIGLKQPEIINTLRRVGIDDITLSNIFDSLDESRIKNAFGRLVELSVD